MQKGNKTTAYIIAIAIVLLVIMIAQVLHKGAPIGENSKEKKKDTEAISEEIGSEETSEEEEVFLEKGYYLAKLTKEAWDYKVNDSKVMYYETKSYAISGENEEAASLINEQITETVNTFLTDVSGMKADAKNAYMEESQREGNEDFMSYELRLNTKLLRNDEGVLSMILYFSSYSGGQHGNVTSYCLNFNAKTGQLLTLSDLLSPLSSASEEAWEASLQEEVSAQCKEREEELFPDYEVYLEDLVKGEGNWALTSQGIQFVADPYEIGPYASGMQVFTLSTSDMTGFCHELDFTSQ